jgi:hypothetical protein
VVAAIVETLGLATVNTSLRMWEWNQTRRKTDPAAPTWIGVLLGVVYVITTLMLIVALEVWPAVSTVAPAIFPFMAVVGTVNLALIAGQERREATVKEERQERKAERQANRQAKPAQASGEPVKRELSDGLSDRLQAGRKAKHDMRLDALAAFYLTQPEAGPSDAARAIGVTRQTVYTYIEELQQAGRIRKNGHVEVIAGSTGS